MSATDPRGSSTRKGPRLFTFFGLDLYIVQIPKAGVVRYIDVSYREPRHEVNPRHLVQYGKIILERRYTVESPSPIPSNELVPCEIIFATLQRVIPTLFLPDLLLSAPTLRSPNAQFGLIAPYVLHQIHSRMAPKEKERNHLDRMTALWGELPLHEITPSNLAEALMKMAPTTAHAFVALLRKIYPSMVFGLPDMDPGIWKNYHLHSSRNGYSPSRVVRSKQLNKPLSPGVTAQCISLCLSNIFQNNEANKYLAAMTMLTEGIELSEVCALRRNSLVQLENCPGWYALAIRQTVLPQGMRDKKKEYLREQRHVIVDLVPPDHRSLGVSGQLADAWKYFMIKNPGNDDDLLLQNPHSVERVFHPDDFSRWLDSTFGHLMPSHTVSLHGKDISSSFDAAQYFIATAHNLLEKQGHYSSEELRYHFALEPLQMDGKKYVGFSAPSELVTMGDMQHAAIAALVGGTESTGRSKKTDKICGHPGKRSRIRITLRMGANEPHNEGILLRLGAHHGYDLDINFRKDDVPT